MELDRSKVYNLKNIYECSLKENPVVIRKVIAPENSWKSYELVFEVNFSLSNEKIIVIPIGFQ